MDVVLSACQATDGNAAMLLPIVLHSWISSYFVVTAAACLLPDDERSFGFPEDTKRIHLSIFYNDIVYIVHSF